MTADLDDLNALLDRVTRTAPERFAEFGVAVADDPLGTLLNVADRLADIATHGDAAEVARVGVTLLGKRWDTLVARHWTAMERLRRELAAL